MPMQHGPRHITAPDMERLLDHAQNIAEEYAPHEPSKASTRITDWGTCKLNGARHVWATIQIIVET